MIDGSNDGDKENVSPSIMSDGQTCPTTDEYSSSSSNNHVDHVDCPEDSDCVFEILEHPKRVDESFGDVATYDEFGNSLDKTSVASDSIANNGSIDFQKDLVDSTPSASETHSVSTPVANESTANPDTTFLVVSRILRGAEKEIFRPWSTKTETHSIFLSSERRKEKFLHTLGYKPDEVLRTVQNSTDEANVVAKSKRKACSCP